MPVSGVTSTQPPATDSSKDASKGRSVGVSTVDRVVPPIRDTITRDRKNEADPPHRRVSIPELGRDERVC